MASARGNWEHERIAKYDCGGGGDAGMVFDESDDFETFSTWVESEQRMCHFQWNERSGGSVGIVGSEKYLAKWDCEADKTGDSMTVVAKSFAIPSWHADNESIAKYLDTREDIGRQLKEFENAQDGTFQKMEEIP